MKNRRVVFDLYGVVFESRPLSQETAQAMVEQLRDRQINKCTIGDANLREVHAVIGRDHGDGFYRLSTGGVWVYADAEVAREDLRRQLFTAGDIVLPLPVIHEPQLLGKPGQKEEWEARRR